MRVLSQRQSPRSPRDERRVTPADLAFDVNAPARMNVLHFPQSVRRVRASVMTVASALEGRYIGGDDWCGRVEITGLHPDGEDLWVQITVVGRFAWEMLLHISAGATTDDVVAALNAACQPTACESRVVHIARG